MSQNTLTLQLFFEDLIKLKTAQLVYQYLCGNHPRPTEAAYPLNIGLRDWAYDRIALNRYKCGVRENEREQQSLLLSC